MDIDQTISIRVEAGQIVQHIPIRVTRAAVSPGRAMDNVARAYTLEYRRIAVASAVGIVAADLRFNVVRAGRVQNTRYGRTILGRQIGTGLIPVDVATVWIDLTDLDATERVVATR